ncbi:MAG: hypoxanthine phosphoribosyltransferase [Armatimonadetes bacterium]|nr:hypoxanthine phosphoribosyltransferase [Armatimonadota bacterium]
MSQLDGIGRVLLTTEQISERVREIGDRISADYEGRQLVLVGILKGAFVFLADLVRAVTIPVEVDFVAFSSYGASTTSSGVVRILKDLDESVEGKHVLIVEDIIDTGLTLKLSYMVENLKARKVAGVRICTFLDKPSRRETDINPDYVGFVVPDEYVIGYGLDLNGMYRNLPFIAALGDGRK